MFASPGSTKYNVNTIVSLGGKEISKPNRSHKLADEMAECRKRIMTRSFDCPKATAALRLYSMHEVIDPVITVKEIGSH